MDRNNAVWSGHIVAPLWIPHLPIFGKKLTQGPLGPKKGPKRPFWGPRRKNQNVGLRSHQNCGRFGTNLSVVALFVSELRSFFQWPPVVFYRFPICVSARGPPKRARIAFLLIDHLNHIEKESTWCARITRRIAPSGWALKSERPILTP